MRQFLTDDAKDDVLTAWRGLKLEKGESMQKYVDKFWDRHLKATVFKRIDFSEQKQQFCAGLPDDMRGYVNAQKPKTISAVIHHSIVAIKIFPSNKIPYKDKAYEKGEKAHNNERLSQNHRGNAKKKEK